jgi:hypothetical protein
LKERVNIRKKGKKEVMKEKNNATEFSFFFGYSWQLVYTLEAVVSLLSFSSYQTQK